MAGNMFAHKNDVRYKDFDFGLREISFCDHDYREPYFLYVGQQDHSIGTYTLHSHRFNSEQEASDFCQKIKSGIISVSDLKEEEARCEAEAKVRKQAAQAEKTMSAVSEYFEHIGKMPCSAQKLYDILWFYRQMSGREREAVEEKLLQLANIQPRIEVGTPRCLHCEHFCECGHKCMADNSVGHLSHDAICEDKFIPVNLRRGWETLRILTVNITVEKAGETVNHKLGNILISAKYDTTRVDIRDAIKEQVIDEHLFTSQMASIGINPMFIRASNLNLDIWTWEGGEWDGKVVKVSEMDHLINHLSPIPGKSLPEDFTEASKLLRRPYYPLTDEQVEKLESMSASAGDTDVFVDTNGQHYTWGYADRQMQLMPLIEEYLA